MGHEPILKFTSEKADAGYGEFACLHPMLQAMYFVAAGIAYAKFRKRFVITSMKRDTGVHGDWRGIDVDVCSDKVYTGGLLPYEAQFITDTTNWLFTYDPLRLDKQCVIYGSADPSGRHWNHIHFQVHPRTEINLP